MSARSGRSRLVRRQADQPSWSPGGQRIVLRGGLRELCFANCPRHLIVVGRSGRRTFHDLQAAKRRPGRPRDA